MRVGLAVLPFSIKSFFPSSANAYHGKQRLEVRGGTLLALRSQRLQPAYVINLFPTLSLRSAIARSSRERRDAGSQRIL